MGLPAELATSKSSQQGVPVGLVAGFTERFGKPPLGVWSAPGRVNLIGEHTDYNLGLVLPVATTWRTWVAASPRRDRLVRAVSVQVPSQPLEVDLERLELGQNPGWGSYLLGPAWVLAGSGVEVPGADLMVDGQLPLGTGLSSSAALECAAICAFADLAGHPLEPMEAARLAQRAENEFAGVPCGLMDQAASMLAREGQALLLDLLDQSWRYVPVEPEADGLTLAVVDTASRHRLSDGGYALRRQECEAAARALGVESLRQLEQSARPFEDLEEPLARRVRHVVAENARVRSAAEALSMRAWADLGALLCASHRSLREDFEVSSPEQDLAVKSLVEAGALGARLTGGGFGGSVVALLPASGLEEAREYVETTFAAAGLAGPRLWPLSAGGGARRDI
jgi:galactokinase